jgi:hypothetical protein
MKYQDLINNVNKLEKEIGSTEPIYFGTIERLREVQKDLSILDISRDLCGTIKIFLIKWGNMARVVGQKNLDWKGFGEALRSLEKEFSVLRDKRFLIMNFDDEVSNAIRAICRGLKPFPYLRGATTVSKILHVLNPEIFVMWDGKIREEYHRINRCINDSPEGYLEFLEMAQKEIMEALNDRQKETGKRLDEIEIEIRSKYKDKTLARIFDEYNYSSLSVRR